MWQKKEYEITLLEGVRYAWLVTENLVGWQFEMVNKIFKFKWFSVMIEIFWNTILYI